MEYQQVDGYTNVFINRDKKEDKHPNFKAELLLDGVIYGVALWKKKTKSGDDYFGLKIAKKGDYSKPAEQPAPIDDNLPF